MIHCDFLLVLHCYGTPITSNIKQCANDKNWPPAIKITAGGQLVVNLLPTIESYNQPTFEKNGRTAEISRPSLRFFRCSQATRAVSLFKMRSIPAQPCWKRRWHLPEGSKMCARWLVYWVMHRQAQRWIFMPTPLTRINARRRKSWERQLDYEKNQTDPRQ